MREIDFLPEWYKADKKLQHSCYVQYIALACIFAAMMFWNLRATYSVSAGKKQLAEHKLRQDQIESKIQEFAKVKNEIAELKKKAVVIDAIDSRISIANVLAEISFLIEDNVTLSRVEFSSVPFKTNKKGKTPKWQGTEDVIFKVKIKGIAADSSDVADLVCRLEESPYFCLVYPSFSRNTNLKARKSKVAKDRQVSEFEIKCDLANYTLAKAL